MEGYGDPFCRYCYPWGKEDQALLAWYRKLGEIRRNNQVLKEGLYEELYSEGGAFVFRRKRIFHRRRSDDKNKGGSRTGTLPSDSLIIAVNRGVEPLSLVLTSPGEDLLIGRAEDLLTGRAEDLLTGRIFEGEVVLSENEYVLLKP